MPIADVLSDLIGIVERWEPESPEGRQYEAEIMSVIQMYEPEAMEGDMPVEPMAEPGAGREPVADNYAAAQAAAPLMIDAVRRRMGGGE